jgi:hypothetical protein
MEAAEFRDKILKTALGAECGFYIGAGLSRFARMIMYLPAAK